MSAAGQGVSIQLRECAKTFPGGVRALEPITIGFAGGEISVLLGPSGCGKTTTLRIIAGLEAPDPGGRILFDGEDVTHLPIEKRNVGMVFQSYALFPNMDVWENIAYGLKVRKVPRQDRDARVREMLAMMRCEALARRRVDQLSGGQRQRVALARALAIRPRVLLLDEPLAALDAKLRDMLRVEIDVLLRQLHITTVYVTHDQAEAMALGDRIIVMEHGLVAQVGRPREIYQAPASRFVADFVGTMNRLTGAVRNGQFVCRCGSIPWSGVTAGTCEVFFRPEAAEITTPDQANISGVVTATFYMGDRTRLVIGGVTEDERTIVVETAARREFARGETVHLRIDGSALLSL